MVQNNGQNYTGHKSSVITEAEVWALQPVIKFVCCKKIKLSTSYSFITLRSHGCGCDSLYPLFWTFTITRNHLRVLHLAVC